MNDLEIEIGRTFGASAFFLYKILESNNRLTVRDLEMESGISDKALKYLLKLMTDTGILTREYGYLRYAKGYRYSINKDKSEWKLH